MRQVLYIIVHSTLLSFVLEFVLSEPPQRPFWYVTNLKNCDWFVTAVNCVKAAMDHETGSCAESICQNYDLQ